MPELKLSRLPERTPVKITISLPPELHRALGAYAAVYRDTYGEEEPITELIPQMLASFLASDRAFMQKRKTLE
ncbi:DUF2274 domain-containing protein [Flavisphingomonas formosensis]|uniref:DUF2274 domain-containing protein n=1 Tax=Flavisphingomonas formosensis TaxID=861534 RepID=UPI0012FB3F2E|nr:DUF2274 domain-containing protein [Sphingomonas formosensis]